MANVLFFLVQVIGISLSGVMAPGPVTATTIAMGARNRHSGALIAVGHGIVEFPLMVFIVLGLGRILQWRTSQIVIGLAGGLFLLIMAFQMFRAAGSGGGEQARSVKSTPVVTGVILSAGNPYFLVWWATVGLGLATTASGFGIWAFVLFAVAHWLCDLIWLWALSWASFKGSVLLGPALERAVLVVCGLALVFFGLFFIYKAIGLMGAG